MAFHSANIRTWNISYPKTTVVGRIETAADQVPVNYVIDAYQKGQEKGREAYQKVLNQQYQANVEQAMKHADKVLEFLIEKQKMAPISIHLNPVAMDKYKVLIVITESDFISDKIDDVYDFVTMAESAWSGDLYQISFSFAYSSEGKPFNYALLQTDGYIFEAKPIIPQS